MRGRHLLSVGDLDAQELATILDTASALKRTPCGPILKGKVLSLVFEKPSLRTRVSFEVGMLRLGGHTIYQSPGEIGLGTREPVKDVARVLSRYVDVIAARTMSQSTVEELAAYASVPVINALSDTEHPCQALADLLTIKEHCGGLAGVRLAYIGDGNNVAASLTQACALTGVNVALACPEDYGVPDYALDRARAFCAESGATIEVHANPIAAMQKADVVYTDVWVSMGQEAETAARREAFAPYTLNADLLRHAPSGVFIMHDLPAHRGEEITDEVIESSGSIIFDQAENRLHAQQALLALMLGGNLD
jgi:ornithine carbamoyltransferase